jgi:protein-S-isoprenylcysteine O-methyltransferase Ste14
MIYIVIGCLAFVFFYIFDLNKITFIHKYINMSFAAGGIILVASTLGILWGDYKAFDAPILLRWFFGLLSLVSLILMLYSLFYALPFSKTYVVTEPGRLIDTGMWALCRHAGVLWFIFLYLFLWLASGKTMMMWAWIIWTFMDVIHVYVQDRWLFPKIFPDYDQYKNRVPFLIPTPVSIKKCIATLPF